MRWWPRKNRDEDLARELQSDLELEEEEQQENAACPRKRPVSPPCALSAIPR